MPTDGALATVDPVSTLTSNRPVALLALDLVGVAVFVLVGRRSHDESGALVGFLGTAWPFAVGSAIGWLATRAWTRPAALVPTGVGSWLGAVVGGLVLRRLVGGGTPLSFVIVTTLVLGALLLGWRAVVAARVRTRASA